MISLKRADLSKAAEWAARGLSPQTPTVAMVATGGLLWMRGSNYDAEVIARVPCEGECDEVFLPGAVFANVVKAMRGADAKITVEDRKVTVQAGSKATFQTATEGPTAWGRDELTELVTIPSANLRKCLAWASLVSGKDDQGQPWMNGVRVFAQDGQIEFRGGNRFSVGRASLGGDGAFNVGVPAVHATKLAMGLSGSVLLSERPGTLVMDDGTLSASLRTMSDPGWPDLPKVYNPPQTHWVVLDRADLIASVSGATVGGNVIVLTSQSDHLEVASSHGLDFAKEEAAQITDTVLVHESESDFSWRFNPAYIVPALKALEGERVRLAGVGGVGPVMVSDWPEQGLFRTVMSMRGKSD